LKLAETGAGKQDVDADESTQASKNLGDC